MNGLTASIIGAILFFALGCADVQVGRLEQEIALLKEQADVTGDQVGSTVSRRASHIVSKLGDPGEAVVPIGYHLTDENSHLLVWWIAPMDRQYTYKIVAVGDGVQLNGGVHKVGKSEYIIPVIDAVQNYGNRICGITIPLERGSTPFQIDKVYIYDARKSVDSGDIVPLLLGN